MVSAVVAGGGEAAAFREDGDAGGAEELHIADEAVAAALFAGAAGAAAEGVAFQAQREGEFQGLDGGVHSVGHMGVDAGDAVFFGAGAHAAADGFVIDIGFVAGEVVSADNHIVHCALGGGGDAFREGLAEGGEEDIGDALGGFHIAAGDAALGARVNEAGGGSDDGHGAQAALVGGGVIADHAAHHIEAGGDGYGAGGVDAAGALGGSAGEVDGEAVAGDGDGDADGDGFAGLAVVVHIVGDGIDAVGDAGDGAAGEAFGVVEEGVHMGVGVGDAVAVGDFGEAAVADADGGDLGGEVALAVVGGAGVAADEGDDGVVELAGVGQFEGRDDEAFLVEFGGEGH